MKPIKKFSSKKLLPDLAFVELSYYIDLPAKVRSIQAVHLSVAHVACLVEVQVRPAICRSPISLTTSCVHVPAVATKVVRI